MPIPSSRQALTFSCLGHAFMHFFAAFYFIIVLQIEKEWPLPYHELIGLWTLGSLLVGLGAVPAGWLSDRWGAPALLVAMFIGMGASAFVCGLAETPAALWVGLCGIGLFCSIYHPVGIPWVVRNAKAQGKALGINGIFGNGGVAGASLLTGALIDGFGWRAAFLVPGAVAVAVGLAMWWQAARGGLGDVRETPATQAATTAGDRRRAYLIFIATTVALSLAYQVIQTTLPKLFSQRLETWVEGGAFGVGALVAAVYAVASVVQMVGGHLADRYPAKPIYFAGLLLQVPALAWTAQAVGMPLVIAATLAVVFNSAVAPAENMLLARYTPNHRSGLVFGLKFVLTFGCAPAAVVLVARLYAWSGEFIGLYFILAACMVLACAAAALLPNGRSSDVIKVGAVFDAHGAAAAGKASSP